MKARFAMSSLLSCLYPLIAIALWAGNVVVSRLAAGAISPPAITFYRLVLALALMSLFVLKPAWRNRAAICAQWPRLACLGLMSMTLYQVLSYLAARSTTATNMAILTSLTPLLTMGWSVWLLREVPTRGMVLGSGVSLVGLLYLISGGHLAQLLQGGLHKGDALMFVAAASYGLYSVLVRRWHVGLPTWQSTYVQACSTMFVMAPVFAWLPAGQAPLDAQTLPLIAYAGSLASVVLPYCWMQGVQRLGPNRASMFMNLLPVFTAAIAAVLLGEVPQRHHWIGGGLALAGVALAQWWSQPLRSPAVKSMAPVRPPVSRP